MERLINFRLCLSQGRFSKGVDVHNFSNNLQLVSIIVRTLIPSQSLRSKPRNKYILKREPQLFSYTKPFSMDEFQLVSRMVKQSVFCIIHITLIQIIRKKNM